MRRMTTTEQYVEAVKAINRLFDLVKQIEKKLEEVDFYEEFIITNTETQSGYIVPVFTIKEFQSIYNSFKNKKRPVIRCGEHMFEVIDIDFDQQTIYQFTLSFNAIGLVKVYYNTNLSAPLSVLNRFVTQ